jgi:4-hydroxybenzoyl-CoA thioesterase
MLLEYPVDVSFGDCDPAGIVFYPNYFRWMDATFHRLLQETAGGHARLCRELGAVGIGLMEVGLFFRSPVTEGQRIHFRITGIDWEARSLKLRYKAILGDRTVLEGHETRGLFVMRDGKMAAADVAALKDRIARW